MKLSDLIIEHGPFTPVDMQAGWLLSLTADQLNELREELIAARPGREAGRFELLSDSNADGTWINLDCGRCPEVIELADPLDLAELNRRAAEHAEVCGG